jgi:release factor glutamine methyltransferase
MGEPDSLTATVTALRAAGCVFAEDEARLLLGAARTPDELADLVRRRADGVPLEVLLGWAQFCGLRIAVEAGVFVPRQRTAFLVQQAVAAARPGAVVLDLCCGTGAIGLAITAALGKTQLHAADLDPVAVRCARRNLAPVGGQVHLGDLFQAVPTRLQGRLNLLVVNAPYVPTAELALLPPEAREHEPRLALDGGRDGLDVQRRVAAEALRWLAPGGSVLIETGEDQGPLTAQALSSNGFLPRVLSSDELFCTVVMATRPSTG